MPTPGAPVITAVAPVGGISTPFGNGMRIDFTLGANTDYLEIETSFDSSFSGADDTHWVRNYCQPPDGCLGDTTSPAFDWEAWRGVPIYYRARGWSGPSGGPWTNGPYSNTMSGTLPIVGSWAVDALLLRYPPTLPVTIEAEQLDYPTEAASQTHFPLGRPDPVMVGDLINNTGVPIAQPPGLVDHYGLVMVPFFFATEAEWLSFRGMVTSPVRPVLVKTCFGAAPGEQFWGQMVSATTSPLTTGDNQSKVFHRAQVTFQTIRRPRQGGA